MDKTSKNIAVSGYYGFDNFGDEAILKVLTAELKKNGFNITVFSKNPQKTAQNLGVNTSYTFDLKGIFKTLKNSDTLISGGGSLLQDVTSIKSLVYYLFVISTALLLKKKVVIFAQGIGPIKNPVCRFFTKLCLKKCSYITVRDAKSKVLLDSWRINAKLVSDPVWNIELPHRTEHEPKRLGIQLRKWHTLTDEYLKKLAKAIAKEFSQEEIFIWSLQDALDLEVCENFARLLQQELPDSSINVMKSLSVDDTIKEFANLDYMIAMRYHACLPALKYSIPTMAISYDEKVEKIAKKFEIPCSFLDETENLDAMAANLKSIDTSSIKSKAEDCRFDFSEFIEFC